MLMHATLQKTRLWRKKWTTLPCNHLDVVLALEEKFFLYLETYNK
jgi:hypothetical protein